jgi:hypothetical protein
MIQEADAILLKCSDSVYWVKDRDGILIVDVKTHQSHVLHNEKAVIWDWLTLSYSYQKIVSLLTVLLEIAERDAEQLLLDTLQAWSRDGILHNMERSLG